ncbi:unnamed protein product [Lupinus luteus]|uniref:Uncharacterized protein n=1 Tax=Lupinus luteus TaxID=3873 RepID=A0AAV1Y7N2_LUPLU
MNFSIVSSTFSISSPPSIFSSQSQIPFIAIPFKKVSQTTSLRCNSSIWPPCPPSGDGDSSKSVLDAFFLGKAVAEAVNERIESTVGEILSTVGRLQAEQQKQIQDFQEEVFERAKNAKEKAAREAVEAQELISKSAPTPSNSSTDPTTSVQSTDASGSYTGPANDEDPASSSAIDV